MFQVLPPCHIKFPTVPESWRKDCLIQIENLTTARLFVLFPNLVQHLLDILLMNMLFWVALSLWLHDFHLFWETTSMFSWVIITNWGVFTWLKSCQQIWDHPLELKKNHGSFIIYCLLNEKMPSLLTRYCNVPSFFKKISDALYPIGCCLVCFPFNLLTIICLFNMWTVCALRDQYCTEIFED